MTTKRRRITLSLSGEIVARVDQAARRSRAPRSQIVEEWLRERDQRAEREQLDAQWTEYYASRPKKERGEDEAIARASGRAAKRTRYDRK